MVIIERKGNMKKLYDTPMVVRMASEIMAMHSELRELRNEVAELYEYREKYNDLLGSSISHSGKMLTNILNMAMTPGVMDAISNSNSRSTKSQII
jgi:hypothetical protein